MALRLATAGSGVPRDNHYEIPNGSTTPVRTLLLEQTKANVAYSNDFTNAAYTKTGCTLSAAGGGITDPDGLTNATVFQEDNTNGVHEIRRTSATGSNSNWGWSVFVRAKERTHVRMVGYGGSGTAMTVTFDLTAGTYVESAGSGVINSVRMVEYDNDWWRLQVHWRIPAFGNQIAYLRLGSNSTTFSYAGDNTSGIYVWGWQFDDTDATINNRGTASTSYIPTTTAQVTRASDTITWPWLEAPQEMTFYVRGIPISYPEGLNSPSLFHIGTFGLPAINFGVRASGSRLIAYFDNVGSNAEVTSQTPTGVLLPGTDLEIVVHFTTDMRVQITHCIASGSIVENGYSSPSTGGFPSAWSTQVLHWCGLGTGSIRALSFAFRNFTIARGIRDMAAMRTLSGV